MNYDPGSMSATSIDMYPNSSYIYYVITIHWSQANQASITEAIMRTNSLYLYLLKRAMAGHFHILID